MYQVTTESFTINAKDQVEAFNILLKLNNLTTSKFTLKMGVDASTLKKAPQWAITYLKDLADINLIHLGYVMKDTKTDGMLEITKRLEQEINKIKTDKSITAQNPIILNKDIVSEQGAIKVAYIANIERLLESFKSSLEAN